MRSQNRGPAAHKQVFLGGLRIRRYRGSGSGLEFYSVATYAQIAEGVKRQSGFTPKTCWIAHVKELDGLKPGVAPNRTRANVREVPCPPKKREAIERLSSAFANDFRAVGGPVF